MIPEDAIWILELIRNRYARTEAEKDAVNAAIEALKAQLSQEGQEGTTSDLISRTETVEALRKALYEYEEKTEKQFQESEDLDVGDWIKHRIFVQNMNDIDRQTILNLPSAQPEPKEGHWIDKGWDGDWAWQIDGRGNCWRLIECSECGKRVLAESNYCPHCGAKMKGETDGRR